MPFLRAFFWRGAFRFPVAGAIIGITPSAPSFGVPVANKSVQKRKRAESAFCSFC